MDKKTLDEQRPGSDSHGLIQRVAFLVWIAGSGVSPQADWEKAKEIISESAYCGTADHWGQVKNPEIYHNTLEWTANGISREKGTDPVASWYLAQDHWANQIFDDYKRKTATDSNPA